MNELKPCPFCGVVPELMYSRLTQHHVSCKFEGCLIQPETNCCPNPNDAIAAWNTRQTQGGDSK